LYHCEAERKNFQATVRSIQENSPIISNRIQNEISPKGVERDVMIDER
jgi:hypothetical protein